jgi:hypothetical protein
MMSDFRGGGGGSKMTPKNRTLEGKNQTIGGEGVKNSPKNRSLFLISLQNSQCAGAMSLPQL